jgi:outer membrane protein assembly factor BamD (BamD/ComL family)
VRKFFVLVLLSALFLPGCAQFKFGWDADFARADRLAKERQYSEALAGYEKIAKESPGSKRSANALFAVASTHVFYDNPHKDYALALQEFDEFLRLYPNNEKARDARNWRTILKMVLELKKENEHLIGSIEQLKRVDIRHEERRKGKSR